MFFDTNLPKWLLEPTASEPDAEFIIYGIVQKLSFEENMDKVNLVECVIYNSALDNAITSLLDRLFRHKVEFGCISQQHYKPICVNAIGAVLKKGSAIPRFNTDCSRLFVCS